MHSFLMISPFFNRPVPALFSLDPDNLELLFFVCFNLNLVLFVCLFLLGGGGSRAVNSPG